MVAYPKLYPENLEHFTEYLRIDRELLDLLVAARNISKCDNVEKIRMESLH